MDIVIDNKPIAYGDYGNGFNASASVGNVGASREVSGENAGKVEQGGGTRKSGECQTCKNRKYKDGSDEMVSFKSPAHISPQAAASRVRAHEMEHVANAYSKAATGNGKVINASVSIKTGVCPECGRVYISGGETNTTIKYSNEEQPYQKNLKAMQQEAATGNNVDFQV